MTKTTRWRIVLGLILVAGMSAALKVRQITVAGGDWPSGGEPEFGATVRYNLETIGTALYTYANENNDDLPPRLSMLYPGYISDPAVFWSPGDEDPCPTTIDNDGPNQINSAQVSFAYLGAGRDFGDPPFVVLQDSTFSHNNGNGVYVLTSDGAVSFFTASESPLEWTEAARTNLALIGLALQAYADDNDEHFPTELSMLCPTYIADPEVFWNPGDNLPHDPPAPTTIDNDVPDHANSAQISYAYLGAPYTSACGSDVILVEDNSPSNNGGAVLNILTADGSVDSFVPTVSCAAPETCRQVALANLKEIKTALWMYANENAGDFPPRLSMLYRSAIYNPTVFWNPGDADPRPLFVDNDMPDQPNSAQISFVYFEGKESDQDFIDIIVQDSSFANNDGLGVHLLTNDGKAEFFEPCDRWLPSSETARANLEQIGAALHAYACDHGDDFPDNLSALYPAYISDPEVFWNPGDADPCPTTIDNDLRNKPNSARISYEYLGAGYTLDCSSELILVQDNSMSNNGGSSVNVLTADGHAGCFAPPPSCACYATCRLTALRNLSEIGSALLIYAYTHAGYLPATLSTLYPDRVPRPTTFWNPGDSDPSPLTIDNDVPDQPNSARISFEYLAAGQYLDGLPRDAILAQDNSPSNNGGHSVLVLFADGHVEYRLLCNDPFADADGDGDVDQDDYGMFQRCLSQSLCFVPPECECFDQAAPGEPDERDWVIDENDHQAFEACASGPGVPAGPACDGD